MVDRGELSGSAAKEIFAALLAEGGEPASIVEKRGLRQISDVGATEKAVDEVLAAYPDEVAKYRAGKTKLLGFFTGQVMKAMRGKGNPAVVGELVRRKLAC